MPLKSQAPSISGDPYIGEILAGDVGGWRDPTTELLRHWVRCGAPMGTACTYIQAAPRDRPRDGADVHGP